MQILRYYALLNHIERLSRVTRNPNRNSQNTRTNKARIIYAIEIHRHIYTESGMLNRQRVNIFNSRYRVDPIFGTPNNSVQCAIAFSSIPKKVLGLVKRRFLTEI